MADPVMLARAYLGTPYRHQGRLPKLDCLGLIVRVGLDLGLTVRDRLDYSKRPDPAPLRAALDDHLVSYRGEPERGAVGMFVGPDWAHCAIFGEDRHGLTMIHAYAPSKKVVETGYRGDWPKQLRGLWRFP